ncbi:hypothetical protein L1049_025146 [Liquidambar formosana]|uniref:hexokinase n=1 Tax=Liquidambar formosana TaxID=63359 RepID=A0AAP0RX52_LIQFO
MDFSYSFPQGFRDNENYSPNSGQETRRIGTRTRNPLHSIDHALAERKRREKVSLRFIALSALLPGLKKMDKASVLGDAVKYLKHLQEHVKMLEEQVAKKTMESVISVKRSWLYADNDASSSDENFVNRSGKPLPEIEARVSNKDVLIRIHCEKHEGFIVKILSKIEKLHLTITHSSVLPFGNYTMVITVVAQVGKELVNEINQALEKNGVNMSVFALVDDTIGDLAGGRYYSRESVAAITLGMGTNEPAQAVPRWHGSSPDSGEMVINTEWGNFSSSHFPITEFDARLDAESSNPDIRKAHFGDVFGRIVRRAIQKMAQETALFGDDVTPKLRTPKLRTPDSLRSPIPLQWREKSLPKVCDIVAERGARLAGAGIVGIIKKLGRIENKRSVVTIEGGLYEHYRVFRNYLHSSVWEMLGNDLSDNVVIEHSHRWIWSWKPSSSLLRKHRILIPDTLVLSGYTLLLNR